MRADPCVAPTPGALPLRRVWRAPRRAAARTDLAPRARPPQRRAAQHITPRAQKQQVEALEQRPAAPDAQTAPHSPLASSAGGRGVVLTQLTPTKAPLVFRSVSTTNNNTTSSSSLRTTDSAAAEGAAAAAAPHGPLASLKALYLPEGFPSSVTGDYLPYQLWSVPTHITGWLSHSLATSSLLKAVGINAGPVGAVAASAAIKWIIKDGIGAAGRFLVGGRLGREFDDDPRRWRMTAEAITTIGLALEISTSLWPQHFLLLASAGNFTKALAKGMGKPVFRVVQTHFAAAGNVGAVAAKEEVWEVSAQLAGYAASVALLQSLEGAGSWQPVVGLWAAVQGAHVALRFAALSQLRFATLNQKRACALAAAHVAAVAAGRRRGGGQGLGTSSSGNGSSNGSGNGSSSSDPAASSGRGTLSSSSSGGGAALGGGGAALGGGGASSASDEEELVEGRGGVVALPGVEAVNASEPMLAPATTLRPRVRIGVTLEQAWGGAAPAGAELAAWAAAFSRDAYLLTWRGGEAWVVVKRGAAPEALLQAVWQAAWLDAAADAGGVGGISSGGDANANDLVRAGGALLLESAAAARAHFPGFLSSLRAAGWDLGAPPVLQMQQTRVVVEGGA